MVLAHYLKYGKDRIYGNICEGAYCCTSYTINENIPLKICKRRAMSNFIFFETLQTYSRDNVIINKK